MHHNGTGDEDWDIKVKVQSSNYSKLFQIKFQIKMSNIS